MSLVNIRQIIARGASVAPASGAHGKAPHWPASQRPVQVAVYDFDGFQDAAIRQRDGWADLRSFLDWLNDGQELFEFRAHDVELTIHDEDRKLLHGFSAKQFYSCLAQQKSVFSDTGCVIGLTHTPLEKGEFNHHDTVKGVGVITIEGYQQYIPEMGTLQRYLAYLIFCEAFCLAGRQQYEHPEHRKCLFDLCSYKPELEDCLRSPGICSICKDRLTGPDSGFDWLNILSVEKFLRDLAKPAFGFSLAATLRRPSANLIAGGGLAVAASTYAATASGIAVWLPSIVLAGVFSLAVFWEYLKVRMSSHLRTRPRGLIEKIFYHPRRWLAARVR